MTDTLHRLIQLRTPFLALGMAVWGTKRIRRTTRLLGLLAVLAAAFAFAAPLEA